MPLGRRRPLLRAAMVGGGAYMAGKKVQQGRDAQYEDAPAQEDVQEAAPPASAGITDDTVTQLERLSALKEKGILTDDEFDAEKRKLLAAT